MVLKRVTGGLVVMSVTSGEYLAVVCFFGFLSFLVGWLTLYLLGGDFWFGCSARVIF